ncbi:helix-turn-helix domain-containing protein [Flavobacterium sp. LB2P44]|uniref:helix-turn-helix domain-containing protein n=1 Tax=Flavobacterium sp. LB2P44 TaxID=3401713 RepID=UPI003AAE1482
MENPFEIILAKLDIIEKAIEKLNESTNNHDALLSPIETCELLNIKRTTLWKWTKNGKLTSYGIGNRVYYKKGEVLNSLVKFNK